MSVQPEALRLADELEAPVGTQSTYSAMRQAAAELRRLSAVEADFHMTYRMKCDAQTKVLHAQRDALLKALRWIDRRCPEPNWADVEPHRIHFEMAHDAGACARAAIASVEETK